MENALNAFVEILLILLLIVTFTANSAKTNVFWISSLDLRAVEQDSLLRARTHLTSPLGNKRAKQAGNGSTQPNGHPAPTPVGVNADESDQ